MTYAPLAGLAFFVAAILLSSRILRAGLTSLSQEEKARLVDAAAGSRRGVVLVAILVLAGAWFFAFQRFPAAAAQVHGAFLGALLATIALAAVAGQRRLAALGLPEPFRRAALRATLLRLAGMVLLLAAVLGSALR